MQVIRQIKGKLTNPALYGNKNNWPFLALLNLLARQRDLSVGFPHPSAPICEGSTKPIMSAIFAFFKPSYK